MAKPNKLEYHPRINNLDRPLDESRIILGSFPTWTLTKPNSQLKEIERQKNREIPFFYGSSKNQFWSWYKRFVDNAINVNEISTIQNSLSNNSIGITDMIISCSRKNKSALDKHLTQRVYNQNFLRRPKSNEQIKIISTSKGVLNDMLLRNVFFKQNPHYRVNHKKSINFQKSILNKLNGDPNLIRNPFYQFIETPDGGSIECFATPSPGSPYRRLIDFGCKDHDNNDFLDRYLQLVFHWFLN